MGSVHPWDVGSMIEGIDPEIARAARNVSLSSFGAINQQIALTEPPRWRAGDEYAKSMLVECVQDDYLALRKVFDSYRYGEMPAGHLSPLIAVQSLHDPSRAPAGKASMYLYHFAPLDLARGGVEGWDEVKDYWCDAIYDEMCRYTTNLDRNSILGAVRETPLDHHRHSASMKHGDIFGIGTTISQFMGRRPYPSWRNTLSRECRACTWPARFSTPAVPSRSGSCNGDENADGLENGPAQGIHCTLKAIAGVAQLKLYTADNTDLMEVTGLRRENDALVVVGTIMGAMPVEARLVPAELRKLFKLLDLRLVLFLVRMLFRK